MDVLNNLGPDRLIDGCQRDIHGVTFANEHALLSPGSDGADDEDALREQQARNDPALAKLGQGAFPNPAPRTWAMSVAKLGYVCALSLFSGSEFSTFPWHPPRRQSLPPSPFITFSRTDVRAARVRGAAGKLIASIGSLVKTSHPGEVRTLSDLCLSQ